MRLGNYNNVVLKELIEKTCLEEDFFCQSSLVTEMTYYMFSRMSNLTNSTHLTALLLSQPPFASACLSLVITASSLAPP